jgi:DNA repair protein RadA
MNYGEPKKTFRLERFHLQNISTGSKRFDDLLGGGLPIACITDIYGAAGTGKTQFAFQNAVMTCEALKGSQPIATTLVVFVDCTGGFRPERIAEISDARGFETSRMLESISSVSVRSVAAQAAVCLRVMSDPAFSHCRLLIVDDVTANFAAEYSMQSEIAERQTQLSLHLRNLSYICNTRGISALLTNSVRSRGERGEGEATGEVLSSFALKRIHFKRVDRNRIAELVGSVEKRTINFEIEKSGIV